jgi:broad specificity phosphatase PhoE
MTSLLVIRHAATDWNEAGRIQGRTDRPLSDTGRQALRAARLPSEWRKAKCLSSPLVRTLETARLLGLDPEPDLRLIEMDWGEWEGRTLADLRAELAPAMTENEARGLDFRPPAGESPRDVQVRLRPFLGDLRAPTIAVTHKGVLRALYALATGWTMQAKASDKLLPNRAHLFVIATDGTPSIAQLNIPLGPRL